MRLPPLRLLIVATATFCLTMVAQTPQVSSPASRISGPVDDSNRVSLSGNVHPLAQARFDRGPAPLSMPTGTIMLVLRRSAVQQQALTQYLADLQNPAATAFHQWLKPAEYGAMFGPSDVDLETIESWLQSHGFKIEKVPAARNIIAFSGSMDQLESTFHTAIHTFSVHGETHFASISDPQIPSALAPVIAGITPLNDFHPQSGVQAGATGRYDPATHTIQPDLTLFGVGTGTPSLFVDPADAATIYDSPNASLNGNYTGSTTYDGTGVNIGIIGISDLTLPDVENYRIAFLGETSSTVNLPTVVVDGNDPGLNSGGDEALIDNEIAGGIAPKAKIYFYTSADTNLSSGLMDAWYRALDDNTVSIINLSFSACEAAEGTAGNQALLEAAEQAAAQGISVTVSAGDGGSAGCDAFNSSPLAQFGLAVNAIASTPYTIAVGGTDFNVLSSDFSSYVNTTGSGNAPYYRTALGYIPEEPWNNSTTVDTTIANDVPYLDSNGGTDIVAGGGGVSTVYSKPAFQSSLTPNDNARDLPDVALLAANGFHQAYWAFCSDNVTDGNPTSEGYTECLTSSGQFTAASTFSGAGGTSASAPAFAGMLALVEQKTGSRLGQADTILYQLAKSNYSAVFHDVTSGNNSVPCAGGTPNCGANGFLTGYDAGAGYDLASGLGSVDVAAMVNRWTTVSLTPTSTTLEINNSRAAVTAVHGNSLKFSVSVNPTSATGFVGIVDTANEVSGGPQSDGQFSVPLTNGSGSATWNGLPGGNYTVSAHYGGSTGDGASSSVPITVTILPESSSTLLSIVAQNPLSGASITNLNSIPYGSPIVLDAVIEGAAEGSKTEGLATGTVTYADGANTLGTVSVNSNSLASWPTATNTLSALAVGPHNVTAKYSGDASYDPSNSSPFAFTVVKDPTSATETASASTISTSGQVGIAVTISTPLNLGAAPTGTVTLTANGKTLVTVTNLVSSTQGSGTAAATVLVANAQVLAQQLNSGANTITATYSGDANYASSTATVNVDVTAVGFSLSTVAPIIETPGQSGSTGLVVTPANGFTGIVNLACVVPAGFTCAIANATITSTASVSSTITVSTPATAYPGGYAAQVTGSDAATGQLTSSTTVNITVSATAPAATFTVSNTGNFAVYAGATSQDTTTINVDPSGGFTGAVSMNCTIAPVTANGPVCNIPSPIMVSGSGPQPVTLTAETFSDTNAGAYTLTVSATDAADFTSSTTLTLTVQPPILEPGLVLASSGNIAINPGATTSNTSTITVSPSNGFSGQVNLSCSITGQPASAEDAPTCAVPASVTVSGNSAAAALLTVTTTAPSTAFLDLPKFFIAGGGATLAVVLFFGIPARRRAWRALFSVLAVVALVSGIGCGNNSSGTKSTGGGGGGSVSGTTAGAYTITVVATDAATGTITARTNVTLSVN